MEQEDLILRKAIVDAVRDTAHAETEAWTSLDALSGNTQIDALETFEDEVRIEGTRFSGPLTWYVTLHYGQEGSADALAASETFPGSFEGRLEAGKPVIERVTADVSSFYE